jgi:RNA polymerase sigma-70 factor (ECF subfamily)
MTPRAPTPSATTLLAESAWIRRLVRGLVRDEHDAEDVAQETMLTALRHRPSDAEHATPWLVRVARNAALRWKQKDEARQRREQAAAQPEALPSAVDSIARVTLQRTVVDAVLALEEPYRITIVQRYFEQLPPREIARAQQVPVATVRTRLRRAVDRLRARLDHEYGDRSTWGALALPWALPTSAATVTVAATTTSIGALGGLAVKESFFAGTLLMSLKAKLAISAVVVLVAGVATWRWEASRGPAPSAATRSASLDDVPPSTPIDVVSNAPGAAPTRTATATNANVPAASKRPHVTGRVVDEKGAPVDRARLRAVSIKKREIVRGDEVAPSTHSRWTTTSADGRFALDLLDAAEIVDVYADHVGFAPAMAAMQQADDDTLLTLYRDSALVGVVRDLESRVVCGAHVTWRFNVANVLVEHECVSDADGHYRIEGIPSASAAVHYDAQLQVLRAQAAGLAPLEITLNAFPPRDEHGDCVQDLWLTAGASVSGVVVDAETGSPIPGARVVVANWGDWGTSGVGGTARLGPPVQHLYFDGFADGSGRFTVDGLPAWGVNDVGMFTPARGRRRLGRVVASADGFAAADVDLEILDSGSTASVEIRCQPSARLRGRVVDRRGVGLAGAEVFVADLTFASAPAEAIGFPTPFATSAADGSFEISTLPAHRKTASKARVRAIVRGATPWLTKGISDLVDVELNAGDVTLVPDLVVRSTASAEVVVNDEHGKPVPAAEVTLCEDTNETTRTDDAGRATVVPTRQTDRGLEQGGQLHVRVVAKRFAVALSTGFVPSVDTPPDVVVQLSPEDRVDGSALRSSETPPTSAHAGEGSHVAEVTTGTVEVEVSDAATARPLLHLDALDLRKDGAYLDGVAIAPGLFRMERVPVGTWKLIAQAPGRARTDREIVVVAGETTHVALALERGVSIKGRLVTPSGEATNGGHVLFESDDGGGGLVLEVRPDGSFDGVGLRRGKSYRVAFSARTSAGFRSWIPEEHRLLLVPIDAESIDFAPRLLAARYVTLNFFSPTSRSSSASLEVRAADGTLVYTRADMTSANYSLCLAVGSYTFRATPQVGEPIVRTADLTPGEESVEIGFPLP